MVMSFNDEFRSFYKDKSYKNTTNLIFQISLIAEYVSLNPRNDYRFNKEFI